MLLKSLIVSLALLMAIAAKDAIFIHQGVKCHLSQCVMCHNVKCHLAWQVWHFVRVLSVECVCVQLCVKYRVCYVAYAK